MGVNLAPSYATLLLISPSKRLVSGAKMTRKMRIAPVAAVLFLMTGSIPASAGIVTFNFNTLGSGADSTAIQNYMNTVLAGNATVAVSAGALADKGYNGDGHVVGVGNSTISRTLGTSEGNGGVAAGIACTTAACSGANLDTWIRNASGIPSFFFDFSSNFIVDSVSFDYQIFPDATCQALTAAACGGAAVGGYYPNQPDFTFSTDLGQVFHSYGTTPAGANTHSPVSGLGTADVTPQKAPINTGSLVFNVAGSNMLTFADWPATIGIDNLVINWHTPPGGQAAVPEPASLLLLGSGLLGVARARRRQRAVNAS